MSEELRLSHFGKARVLTAEARAAAILQLRMRYLDANSSDDDIFVWEAEISNDLLDSHFTRMAESTLGNYAADSEAGVAFLRGHNWSELPIGYSFSGDLQSENGKNRVVASFYTARGIPEADDLIARMKAGLVRDVSVGFHGGQMRCDLCGQDFWECRHYPGIKYEEKKGDVVTTQLATFTIEDARLSEVSGVFDGSTPEAMILKAQRAAKAGTLSVKEAEVLEKTYRTRLAVTRTFAVPEIPKEEVKMERVLDEKQFQKLVDHLAIRNLIDEEARKTITPDDAVIAVWAACERIKELTPLAEDGTTYRNDLVSQAIAEGVRAQGNDFNKELYEGTLRNSPLTVVKQMRDDWKRVADSVLPAGRRSADDSQGKKEIVVAVPDAAYS